MGGLDDIKQGSVYYFRDGALESSEPHFFIVLNHSPKTEEVLILAVASSQIEKRKKAARRLGFFPGTLVFVSPKDFAPFTMETVIDCNRPFERAKSILAQKVKTGGLKICTEIMPKSVVKSLISGILFSNLVSEKIKKQLR